MNNSRILMIEKLLEMCKYIKWHNVENFDELESDYIKRKVKEIRKGEENE